jgi:hypothetical protein
MFAGRITSSSRMLAGCLVLGCALSAAGQGRSFRLPDVDIKQRIIWGSTCEGPDGIGLAFGGQDQEADRGQPPTRIRVDGKWQEIGDELRTKNPLQPLCDEATALARRQKEALARARHTHLEGLGATAKQQKTEAFVNLLDSFEAAANFNERLRGARKKYQDYELRQVEAALELLEKVTTRELVVSKNLAPGKMAEALAQMWANQIDLERAAEALAAEPPGRALSPIDYEPQTKGFVLFGGDHLDYLTNDTWTFDWASRQWRQLHPEGAPPPRANHTLQAAGDGKIVMSGGYQYTSNTDYMGGQYRDWDDGEWTFDLVTGKWTGGKSTGGELVPADERIYRTGPFHPQFFLGGPRPDAAAFAARLESLPVNTWVRTSPPQLPQMNRDWGTAVLDPDHDLILRFSGGHSAHGGSDVLHFHLASNRWELPFPVEFPLGQTYTNTSYPEGFNLNQRPWVTGHTYQNYGYESAARKMLFTGREKGCYLYDPQIGDWAGRIEKPPGMTYNSCFYTLTLCPTPQGLAAWTAQGNVFRFDAAKNQWIEIKQQGERLPGAVVDNSTMVFDSHRGRLLFARKPYGDKTTYDGVLYTLDPSTGQVDKLTPQGSAGAAAIPYLCQIRYDADHDLLLVGGTLPPAADGSPDADLRRTPAYDCSANRWVSLKLTGDDPSGKAGRNVSLGLMYDAKRKLFWAVDTKSEVFVLRLDPKQADLRPLE